MTPDGRTAYVVNHGDDTVTPISLGGPAGIPGPPIRVGRRPTAIVIAPGGSAAYVANHGDGTVTPISLAAGAGVGGGAGVAGVAAVPGTPIKVGRRPWALAVTGVRRTS